MKQIYLYPGDFACSAEPALITTILGSCVGVALYDRVAGVGGLNHYLLPRAGLNDPITARYGEVAIPSLIEAMESLGAQHKRMTARVFGGANVLFDVKIGLAVGQTNIETALRMLSILKISVIEQNTGGIYGRRIVLNTQTFEVEHKLQEHSPTSGKKAA